MAQATRQRATRLCHTIVAKKKLAELVDRLHALISESLDSKDFRLKKILETLRGRRKVCAGGLRTFTFEESNFQILKFKKQFRSLIFSIHFRLHFPLRTVDFSRVRTDELCSASSCARRIEWNLNKVTSFRICSQSSSEDCSS